MPNRELTPRIHFYDAATPQNVPTGVYAAPYVNGFAWPENQIKRMGHIFRISVLRDAFWAKYARCIDVETNAALPSDVPGFLRMRLAHHFNDGTVYVNRGNWQACYDAVAEAKLPQPLWWVATLDDTMYVELIRDGKVLARPWAVQYRDVGPYDLSVLYGINNFHRP